MSPLPQGCSVLCHCSLRGASSKESASHYRRHKRCGFDPWVRKIPWRRKWQPLQYSCLENSMDRATWQATVMGHKELDTSEHTISTHTHTQNHCLKCSECDRLHYLSLQRLFFLVPSHMATQLKMTVLNLLCSQVRPCDSTGQ